ncbi:hypothetical protein OG241_08795 [Streptomyces sp. NBC_01390]|uniref:hypothetical protein n=1 Tax=Streptomyces sp. NBC_01390 TaxID=2903850 RepID=UPI003250C4DD
MSTLTRPRTCGARIPTTETLKNRAYAERRGVPGMVRSSIVCELAEHELGSHWGIAREFATVQGGAVWVTWAEDDVPSCLAKELCSRTSSSKQDACALFSEHPGVCSFDFEITLAEDPFRAGCIDAALRVLAACERHDQQAVHAAAHDATLLTWDELRAGIWTFLPDSDQAAVYRLLSRTDSVRTMKPSAVVSHAGDVTEVTRLWSSTSPCRLAGGEAAESHLTNLNRLPTEWQVVVLGGQRPADSAAPRTPIAEALQAASLHAEADHAPPPAGRNWEVTWDRQRDREIGARVVERLSRLPYGWRVDAMRRMTTGMDALSAVTEAVIAINIIRAYGLHFAWNARHQPRRVLA